MLTRTRGELREDLWGLRTGRHCSACGAGIHSRDGIGMDEGVCPACRGDLSAEVDVVGRIFGGGRSAARAAAALGGRASRSLAALRRAS